MERKELTAIVATLYSLRRPGSVNKMSDRDMDVCVGEAMRILDRVDEFEKLSVEERHNRLAGKPREAIDKDKTDMKLPEGALDETS